MDLTSLFLDKTVVILVIVAASAGIRPITGNTISSPQNKYFD